MPGGLDRGEEWVTLEHDDPGGVVLEGAVAWGVTVGEAHDSHAASLVRTFPTPGPSSSPAPWPRPRLRASDSSTPGTTRAGRRARDDEGGTTGRLTLSGITRGALRSCPVVYGPDRDHTGRGLATQAVGASVAHTFPGPGLHRVQVEKLLDNAASQAVPARAGLGRIGAAPGSSPPDSRGRPRPWGTTARRTPRPPGRRGRPRPWGTMSP
ncbi:GNAT family N-acetyltransferase [Actinomyces polynesiensis]|uniref:GNAT family N-acetyltransferase n=1 Tax=Actinomyces polynesiensis TaxID=1325934 RepID=UPI0038B40418